MEIKDLWNPQDLIDWAKQALGTLGNRNDSVAIKDVNQAIEGLKADRICLAVLGKAKRGKSTLLNAILGRKDDLVAPVDKLPASSAISRFRWAAKEQSTVVFRDGRREQISFDQIREFVTEECNKENSKGVDIVEVEGPFEGLDHNSELIDTPGAGSIHEHHDAILHAFIPHADAAIFLVTARMPLDQDEINLLQKVKAADISKIFFAVNRVDESNETDIADAIAHNLRLLAEAKIPVDRMYRISAKTAFKGDLDSSGVDQLMADISAFLKASKGQVLSSRFVSRVKSAIQPIAQALEVEIVSGRRTAEELKSELAELRRRKSAMESDREFAERKFSLAWSNAVESYERGLKEAKTAVTNAVLTKINRTPVSEVTALSKELPAILARAIEDQLRPVAYRFEEAAKEACDCLQASYPALSFENTGNVALRIREDQTAINGAVGGLAVAAAGFGFASAGAATAATIAAANAAAAAAATTTVAAPSVLTALLPVLGLEVLAPLATGTATLSTPVALTTAPLWVALAGPLGWTLAGVGVLAVPLSWRLSKLKMALLGILWACLRNKTKGRTLEVRRARHRFIPADSWTQAPVGSEGCGVRPQSRGDQGGGGTSRRSQVCLS